MQVACGGGRPLLQLRCGQVVTETALHAIPVQVDPGRRLPATHEDAMLLGGERMNAHEGAVRRGSPAS